MKIVFMGTSDFSLGILQALYQKHQILAVVTQEDRPSGRGKKLKSPPVKDFCEKRAIKCFQYLPSREELIAYEADVMVVAAYGRILPENLLNLYSYGAINVHTSLLPKYRGASPIQTALLWGEERTGISIMKMAPGMDTGEIYLQKELEVGELRYGELEEELMKLAVDPLLETLDNLEKGQASSWEQEEEEASYCSKILKADSQVDWTRGAREIEGLIRALWPNPMAYTLREGERLLLHRVRALDTPASKGPGIVEATDKKGIYVATGQGVLLIEELQRPGRRPLEAQDYLRGNAIEEGERLG